MNRTLKTLVAAALSFSLVFQQSGFAQVAPQLPLPAYLNSIALPADAFKPVLARGLSVDAQGMPNFLLVPGNGKPLNSAQISSEQRVFSDYFSIGLSLPDSSFWVNLRPDSPDKVIDPLLGQTDLGKVLLEADLQLKKDLAALTNPSTAEGNRYWTRLYQKAEQLFPNENAEIPTYNRPWIVPGEVILKENGNGVLIYKANLKVMLEQDHLKEGDALMYAAGGDPRFAQLNDYSSRLIRELILPRLTVIVNSSKRYASLRQAYNALILAQWFKSRIRQNRGSEAIAALGFENGNLDNLRSAAAWQPKTYFDRYAASFSKGEYSTEEAVRSPSGITVRKYFSGGINFDGGSTVKRLLSTAFTGYLSALMFSGSAHAVYVGDAPTAALAAAAGLAAGAATHSIYKNMGRDVAAAKDGGTTGDIRGSLAKIHEQRTLLQKAKDDPSRKGMYAALGDLLVTLRESVGPVKSDPYASRVVLGLCDVAENSLKIASALEDKKAGLQLQLSDVKDESQRQEIRADIVRNDELLADARNFLILSLKTFDSIGVYDNDSRDGGIEMLSVLAAAKPLIPFVVGGAGVYLGNKYPQWALAAVIGTGWTIAWLGMASMMVTGSGDLSQFTDVFISAGAFMSGWLLGIPVSVVKDRYQAQQQDKDGGINKVKQTTTLRISLNDLELAEVEELVDRATAYLEWINSSDNQQIAFARIIALLLLDEEVEKGMFGPAMFVEYLPDFWEVMDKSDDALIKLVLNPRSTQRVQALVTLASRGDNATLMKLRKARVHNAVRSSVLMSTLMRTAMRRISERMSEGSTKDGGVEARLSKHERLVHSLAVLIERLDKEVGKESDAAPKRIEQILWEMQKYLVRIEPQAEAFLADDHVDNMLPGDVIYFKSKAGAHQGICIECRGDALTYLRIDYPPIPIELNISLVSDESMHEISNLRIIRVYRQDRQEQGRDGGEDATQKHLRNLAMDEQVRRGTIENIDVMNAVLSERLQQAYAKKAAQEEIDTLVKQLSENVLKGAEVRKQSDAFMRSLLEDITNGDPLRTQFALEQFDRKLRASQRFPRRLQNAYWDTLASLLHSLALQQPVRGEDYRLARARENALAMLVRLGILKRGLSVAGEVIEAALSHPDFNVRLEAFELQKRLEADKDGGAKAVDQRVASLRAVLDQLNPYLLDKGQPVFGEPEMTKLLWELQSCFAALKPAALPVEMDYGPREVRSGDILYITEKPGEAPREAICLASRDFKIDYMRFDFPPVPIDIQAEVVVGKPLLDFHRIDVFSIRDGGDERINEQIADALISFMESMRGSSREQIEQGLKPLLAGYLALVHRGIEPVIREEIESDPIATSLALDLGSRWDEYDALVRDIAKNRFSLPSMEENFLEEEQGRASYAKLAVVAAVFAVGAGLGASAIGHLDYSSQEHSIILGDAQPPEDMVFMFEHGLQSDRISVMRQVTDDALNANLKRGSLLLVAGNDSFDPVNQEIALRDDLINVSTDVSEPTEVRVEAVKQLGRIYAYLFVQTEAFIDEYEQLVNTTNADIDTDDFRVFYEPVYDTLSDLAENDNDPAVRAQANEELELILARGQLVEDSRDGGDASVNISLEAVADLRDDDGSFERFYTLATQNRWMFVRMTKPKVRTTIKEIAAAMQAAGQETFDAQYIGKEVRGVNLFKTHVYRIDVARALLKYAGHLNAKDGGSAVQRQLGFGLKEIVFPAGAVNAVYFKESIDSGRDQSRVEVVRVVRDAEDRSGFVVYVNPAADPAAVVETLINDQLLMSVRDDYAGSREAAEWFAVQREAVTRLGALRDHLRRLQQYKQDSLSGEAQRQAFLHTIAVELEEKLVMPHENDHLVSVKVGTEYIQHGLTDYRVFEIDQPMQILWDPYFAYGVRHNDYMVYIRPDADPLEVVSLLLSSDLWRAEPSRESKMSAEERSSIEKANKALLEELTGIVLANADKDGGVSKADQDLLNLWFDKAQDPMVKIFKPKVLYAGLAVSSAAIIGGIGLAVFFAPLAGALAITLGIVGAVIAGIAKETTRMYTHPLMPELRGWIMNHARLEPFELPTNNYALQKHLAAEPAVQSRPSTVMIPPASIMSSTVNEFIYGAGQPRRVDQKTIDEINDMIEEYYAILQERVERGDFRDKETNESMRLFLEQSRRQFFDMPSEADMVAKMLPRTSDGSTFELRFVTPSNDGGSLQDELARKRQLEKIASVLNTELKVPHDEDYLSFVKIAATYEEPASVFSRSDEPDVYDVTHPFQVRLLSYYRGNIYGLYIHPEADPAEVIKKLYYEKFWRFDSRNRSYMSDDERVMIHANNLNVLEGLKKEVTPAVSDKDGGKQDLSTARPGLAVNNPGGVDFRATLSAAQVTPANTAAITAGMISQIASQASFQVKDLKAVQKQLLSRINNAQTAQELPVQELKACLAVCSQSGAETAETAEQISLCLMNILAQEEARGLESSAQVQELLEFAEACQA